MGHLTPFLRLAASISAHRVQVTIITPQTTVSLSESQTLSHFLSSYPQISLEQLHLLPLQNPSLNSEDPFYLQYEAIRHSSHLLPPLLSSMSPPLSALVTDMSLASTVLPVTKSMGLPNYVLFTSSAKMLTLFASFHAIIDSEDPNFFQIPGVETTPGSWIPPPLVSENPSLLKTHITDNGKSLIQSDGILINSCQSIERETLEALNGGGVVKGLPKVTAVGPFCPWDREKSESSLPWLDDQQVGSVLYISFGSRTAMSREQIRELGDGLVRSGCRFLWVVKEKKVDREDEAVLEEVFGHELMERVKGQGLVVKNWVNQEEVLGHKAIGGFVSHCGWNSVMEAAWNGVPVVAWPQHGDQKMNAWVVKRIGLGVWAEEWGWGGGDVVVKSGEIEERVREVMGDELVKERAENLREKVRRAVGDGGSSWRGLVDVIEMWKKSSNHS